MLFYAKFVELFAVLLILCGNSFIAGEFSLSVSQGGGGETHKKKVKKINVIDRIDVLRGFKGKSNNYCIFLLFFFYFQK